MQSEYGWNRRYDRFEVFKWIRFERAFRRRLNFSDISTNMEDTDWKPIMKISMALFFWKKGYWKIRLGKKSEKKRTMQKFMENHEKNLVSTKLSIRHFDIFSKWQMAVKVYQLFATVLRWSLENLKKKYQIYRSIDEEGREKKKSCFAKKYIDGVNLSDFQQIQVKFHQLFATVIRWSLEN